MYQRRGYANVLLHLSFFNLFKKTAALGEIMKNPNNPIKKVLINSSKIGWYIFYVPLLEIFFTNHKFCKYTNLDFWCAVAISNKRIRQSMIIAHNNFDNKHFISVIGILLFKCY